jgi:glutamate dehydrogenase
VLLERSTRWLLRNRRRPLDIAATIAQLAPGARAIAATLPRLLGPGERDAVRAHAAELEAAGTPRLLAERIAQAEALVPALELVELATANDLDSAAAAEVYFSLGTRLELQWLRDQIIALPRETRWDAMARAALRDDVYAEQAALTAEVLRGGLDGQSPRERVDAWLAENAPAVERCLQVVGELRAAGPPDLARLSVVVREVRNLITTAAAREAASEPAPAPVRRS